VEPEYGTPAYIEAVQRNITLDHYRHQAHQALLKLDHLQAELSARQKKQQNESKEFFNDLFV
jgi:hypothetical protein